MKKKPKTIYKLKKKKKINPIYFLPPQPTSIP